VLRNLLFGPLEVATHGGDAYGGTLRQYVVQTLRLNAGLYALCFAGIAVELARVRMLDARRRIALIFTIVITALVFLHNQPWPYVFIMALPFMALWVLVPFDRLRGTRAMQFAAAVLGIAVVLSFVRNVSYLRYDNRSQLEVVSRAESLLGPDDIYFDGIGMLPNRREPSTLWLDRAYVLKTLAEGKWSEAYRIFAATPPKLIIWTYRMDAIAPVVDPLIRDSYVQVAPNIRLPGRRLNAGQPTVFDVPVPGTYALYDELGRPAPDKLAVNGAIVREPVYLGRGRAEVKSLSNGEKPLLLLPEGRYAALIKPGADDRSLFADVYN
jgi:hypothetical protein